MSLILRKPNLMDVALCASKLIEADREQWCEFGVIDKWDASAVALECWSYAGPKWAICGEDGMPLAVAGCRRMRRHVYQSWFLSGNELWTHGKKVTEVTQFVMREMLAGDAHRIETLCLASRSDARSWYETIGLHFEAEFPNYGVSGAAAAQYAIYRTPEK